MGSKRGSITHVEDVERLIQELKMSKQKTGQFALLEELSAAATLEPGREKILTHGGIAIIAETLTSPEAAVRISADRLLRQLVGDERSRLQIVKKLVPLLKHHALRTRMHAMVHIAEISGGSTLNRAWLVSAGVLQPVLGFLNSEERELREAALGCLYWLGRELEVPPQVAKADIAGVLLKFALLPCGPSERERRFSLGIIHYLPESAGVPIKGLLKCLAPATAGPAESFTVTYTADAFSVNKLA